MIARRMFDRILFALALAALYWWSDKASVTPTYLAVSAALIAPLYAAIEKALDLLFGEQQ